MGLTQVYGSIRQYTAHVPDYKQVSKQPHSTLTARRDTRICKYKYQYINVYVYINAQVCRNQISNREES